MVVPRTPVARIAILGDEHSGYPSHIELNAARRQLAADAATTWVPTDASQAKDLSGFDGVWLAPGSPYANDANVYAAIQWARERNIPFLGTCGGLQYAVIEFFRHVLGKPLASHAESDGIDAGNVVTLMACSVHGQEREVRPVPGTWFAELTADRPFMGMHYCNYAPSADAIAELQSAGMTVEALADDAGPEVLRLPAHDFYVLSLFQPQIGAVAGKPLHPLLLAFVRAAHARDVKPDRWATGSGPQGEYQSL